jgi:hypothetical protein
MSNIFLGSNVVYTTSRGEARAAIVIGTNLSLTPQDSLPVPQEDHVHLLVLGLSGPVQRLSVPKRSAVVENPDFARGGYFENVVEWDARVKTENALKFTEGAA